MSNRMRRALRKLRAEVKRETAPTKHVFDRFRCDECRKETPHRWTPAVGWQCVRCFPVSS